MNLGRLEISTAVVAQIVERRTLALTGMRFSQACSGLLGQDLRCRAHSDERLALMRRIAARRTMQREVAEQLGLSLRQVEPSGGHAHQY